ncbi:MAG: BatA domain-containing protein, partial [Rhodobacterales bacterium]|nr:BatA domain-containing protein [Rhodobacterales bacterium]
MVFGALEFAFPWALAALAALPLIWWLLRLTPPQPDKVVFPPLRLLLRVTRREESAARTPPWLLILRLVLAAAVILGAAHPLWNARQDLRGNGPVILVVDDGWASGQGWSARRDTLTALIDQAQRDGRPVVLAPTARRE